MEIPQDIQNKLKCSKCDALLSCGPVYMLHETGGAICGRCSQQPSEREPRTRNGPYEATASFLEFPCVYAARGCPEKLKFSLEHPPHELSCKFRIIECPLAPPNSCNWTGSWHNLKRHCDEKHKTHVFENPCNPPLPDLTRTNLQTYLISAFSLLFIVKMKVCETSGNLYHSVWMFGNPKYLDKFSVHFDFEGNNKMFSKLKTVCSPGNTMRQDPITVCTTTNSFLHMLNGNELKFTIMIEALFKFCLNCLKQIENDSNAKFCKNCEVIKCKFHKNGCLFLDVNKKKCEKHENMFCDFQKKCCKCDVDFSGGSLIEHLASSTSCQTVINSNINSVVRITPSNSNINYILFSSESFGTIICLYKLSYSNLDVYFYTSLPSHELKNLKCSIELIDPQTKHTQTLIAQYLCNNWRDWYVNKEMHSSLFLKNSGVDIKIHIDKK